MRQGSTVRRPRRVLVALAVAGVLLTGCSSIVAGSAIPGTGEPTDVPPDQFPIIDAQDGNAVDQGMRNALTDLDTFWGQAFPAFFGGNFQPLQGGVFSVDPDDVDPSVFPDGVGCGAEPAAVENNAFYCLAPREPNSDSITYDRTFLAELAGTFGHALVPVVMAHEFGHAVQARIGDPGARINAETQADCFAGAWTRWVVDGNAAHVAIRKPDLDDVIRGYLRVSDPVGRDPESSEAHGSYFDRVSAIAEGYQSGVGACRDNFGPSRLFTARPFQTMTDLQNQGNAPYAATIDYTEQTLPAFWQSVFPAAFGANFDAPALTAFDRTAPACLHGDGDLGYCASDRTVYYDETDLVRPAYSELGDFAVPTAISLPYSLAARAQLGLSTDDGAATRSAVCLTGWYEAQIFSGKYPTLKISPGDIDEAVEFLLEYGVEESVFPNTDATGFELLQQYRAGFIDGGTQCDIGIRR